MVFYAVSTGRNVGIFLNWNDCNNSVKGYKNALYKKFETKEEADAFIQSNNKTGDNITYLNNEKQNPITSYFDTIIPKKKNKLLILFLNIMYILMELALIMEKIMH